MARIEVIDGNIKGVLIDGYMPGSSYLQKIDWMKILDEKLPSSEEYRYHFKKNIYGQFIKPGKKPPKDSTRTNIYRNLIKNLRKEFCPYNGEPCSQFQHPVKGTHSIERMISFERKEVRDVSWFPIKREIEKSLSEGKGDYIFHFAYLDLNRENYCPIFEKCSTNWMETMGFKTKKEEDYADFEAYKKAVETLLKSGINFQVSRFSKRNRPKNRDMDIDMF